MVDTLILCPLPYLSLSIPQQLSNAPFPSSPMAMWGGQQYPLYYRTSRDICLLSMQWSWRRWNRYAHVQYVHTHTHTHSGYLGSEIINANRAAADREGGERQTQGQVRSNKQSRERKYAKRGGNMSALAQNIYNSFVCVQYISHESFRLDSLFIVHQLIQMITHAGNGAACARDKQKHAMEEIRGQIRERT